MNGKCRIAGSYTSHESLIPVLAFWRTNRGAYIFAGVSGSAAFVCCWNMIPVT